MFSKAELEYLKSPEKFDAAYGRVLRHRINAKNAQLREALSLIGGNGLSITESCNGVTEFSNAYQSINQAPISQSLERVGAPAGIWTRVADSKGQYT
jgi:hypothetical protein